MLLLGSFGGDPADRLRVDTRRRLRAARERRAPATVPGRRAPDAGRGLRPGQMGVGKCVFFSSPIGFPRGARGGWGVFFPRKRSPTFSTWTFVSTDSGNFPQAGRARYLYFQYTKTTRHINKKRFSYKNTIYYKHKTYA